MSTRVAGLKREIQFNMKIAGIGNIVQQLGFLGFSFLFLEMGMNRASQSIAMVERAQTNLLRVTESIRLTNLAFGEETQSLIDLQGNLADIQGLVEQATLEVGQAQVAYLLAVRDSEAGSFDAALALSELITQQEKWGLVLTIGAPLVKGATTDIQNYEDAIDDLEIAQKNLESIQKMNRIQLVMMVTFITGTAISAYVSITNAMKAMAIASATAQALSGPAGIAKVVAGLAVAGAAAATIAALIPMEGFQHGGVITRPTIGLLGERGTEAVLTADQMRMLGGSRGGREEIHIHLDVDGNEIAQTVFRRARA